jgi:hypothetical protein
MDQTTRARFSGVGRFFIKFKTIPFCPRTNVGTFPNVKIGWSGKLAANSEVNT